jgi:hypothetical protein
MTQENIHEKTENNNLKIVASNNGTNRELDAKTEDVQTDGQQASIVERSFAEKWEHHRFSFIRATYLVFNTAWIVVMAIGGFIAWLVAMLFI